jgi:myo-inositol-1-phosphate synthase
MDIHSFRLEQQEKNYKFHVEQKFKKIGVMIIGICSNTSTCFISSLLAQKNKMLKQDYFKSSLSQYGMVQMGYDDYGFPISKSYKDLLDLNDITDICFHGWDIVNMNLYEATKNNSNIDVSIREHCKEELMQIKPMPSFSYTTSFSVESSKINSEISKWKDFLTVIQNIESFKQQNNIEKVIVLWCGNTELLSPKMHNLTKDNLIEAILQNDVNISPSMIFAVASLICQCIFVNCRSQNIINDALYDLANEYGGFILGQDLKYLKSNDIHQSISTIVDVILFSDFLSRVKYEKNHNKHVLYSLPSNLPSLSLFFNQPFKHSEINDVFIEHLTLDDLCIFLLNLFHLKKEVHVEK